MSAKTPRSNFRRKQFPKPTNQPTRVTEKLVFVSREEMHLAKLEGVEGESSKSRFLLNRRSMIARLTAASLKPCLTGEREVYCQSRETLIEF